MKAFLKRVELYEFNELNESAKDKARANFLESFRDSNIFTESINESLKEYFKYSRLNVQYSLSYSQGDGLNLYRRLFLSDMLELIKAKFTPKEARALSFYFSNCRDSIELPENRNYCYYKAIRAEDESEDFSDELRRAGYKNINKQAINKFFIQLESTIRKLCADYEKNGYSYFYETDDEEIKETCGANGFLFYQNGNIFYNSDDMQAA